MTFLRFSGKFIPGIIGLAFACGYLYVTREPQSLTGGLSSATLAGHWARIAAYIGFEYFVASAVALSIFRSRLRLRNVLFCLLHAVTGWVFVTLHSIFSDPLSKEGLSGLGLLCLRWPLLYAGIIWSVVACYEFAKAVDSTRTESMIPRNALEIS